jgi:ubiquinone/menaquinone biosynthesis C-methylase UbiE
VDEGNEDLMSALVEAKRAFYREDRIAERYDQQRFGGVSGAYVNERELALTTALLPIHAAAMADVGAGTGRLLPVLRVRADRVLALDASLAMLGQGRAKQSQPAMPGKARDDTDSGPLFVQADAFALPLQAASLDAITCMRVLFHFEDVRSLLGELRRVARLGGVLVCDTTTWSPRGLLPLGRRFWGERVAVKSRVQFRLLAQQAGWRVRQERGCFLISPYMYRRLPLALARGLERLERHLPRQWLCRRFWQLEAAA